MKIKHFLPLFLLSLLILGNAGRANAQSGSSYFADFQLTGRANQGNILSMTQDFEGNMQMATSNGVVVFDGAITSLVGTGADVFKLEYVPQMRKSYVGCDGKIGYISKNGKAKFDFNAIKVDLPANDNLSFGDIAFHNQDVYFQSSDWVIKVTNDKFVQKWKRPAEGDYSGLFILQNKVFVNISSAGLYLLSDNGTMKKHAINDARLAEDYIAFSFLRSNNEIILGTDENALLLFNGNTLTELELDKSHYLMDNILTGGKKVDNTYMALTTYSGGLLVANMFNGMVSEMYNTNSGFPDDQISCITIDQNFGIWASHELGLTRIDRNIPVKFFSAYPGLHSRVNSIAEANGVLYVGCSDGLYFLKQSDNVEEYQKALKISDEAKKADPINHGKRDQKASKSDDEISTPTSDPTPVPGQSETPGTITPGPSNPTTPTEGDENAIDKASKKIKNLWKKAKKKVDGGDAGGGIQPTKEKSLGGKVGTLFNSKSSIYTFATLGVEKGIHFFYSKIPGIESKVKKLLVTSKGLVCATNNGLYLFSGSNVAKLYSGDIKDAVYSFNKVLFVTATGANIMTEDGTIYPILISPQYRNIATVFMQNPTTVWLGSVNRVIVATIGATGVVSKETVLNVPSLEFRDNITVAGSGDKIYLVSASGLFEYDPSTKTVKKDDNAISDENEVFHYVISPLGNTLFVRTEEGWKELQSANAVSSGNLNGLMDVITDIRYLYKVNNNSIWVLSGDGNIYRLIKPDNKINSINGFNAFIRGINGFKGAFDLNNLSISYQEASVEIKWGSNFFLKSDGTWYQWKMDGAGGNKWSAWTRQTSLKIQLQPGSYTFAVRARDVFGQISKEGKLSFRISPPFWQTWWFYTIIALVAGAAIWYIFRWRNKALIEKQKQLEAMVKERTLELADEKEKTEELLLNILPKAVAQELKDLGQSRVRKHSDSAVMFTDFCDFTKLSKNMTAEELVAKLDTYFRSFDEIVEKYGLEKIKTIGDSYMCAAGVPQPIAQCALSIVMAALEILQVVEAADTNWKIRVGIHQGELVSGVVGKKKFAYDIWGDTVNVASRMDPSRKSAGVIRTLFKKVWTDEVR